MKMNILNLIDFGEVNKLLEGFNKSTGFVTAILDLEGNILSKSGWRQICTEFHRINPETSKKCSISDTTLAGKLGDGEKYHFYECLNGLVDVAVPIIINGEHIANLFSGQFFFDEPDRDFFIKQASKYGFNEDKYLRALEEVPVVSKEKAIVAMDFLLNMTQLISEITFQKIEQSQLNIALRKSEEKYRLVSDNSDDWIYWIAPDGHLPYVSPACQRVTGYSPEEFVSRPELIHEIVIETDLDKVRQHTQIATQDDTPHYLEFRILTKTGEQRWINHSCSPIYNDEGEYLGRRITNRNITERKHQEEQLNQSEFRFNRLWDKGPFGLMIVNQEFQYKHVNPTFCKIMGYSEAELLQLTFKDISHPDDLVKDLPNIRMLINKEISVYKTEKRYIHKDGQVIWGALTVTAYNDNEGQFLYNLAIVEDITRRKLAEEELKNSKKLLAETEFIGKVGGWEFNIDTLQTTWTDEVYRIHEVDFDFYHNVNKGINFYTQESKPIIEKAVQRVIEYGEPFDLELEIITAKGNLKKVHTIGKPDLESHRVYGFFQDITERKQLEESLRTNEARLRNIFEQANDGIYIINADNQYLDVNEKGLELLDYSRDELLKMNVSDVLRPDEVARLAIEPPQMMSGIPHLAEWIHIRKDGSSFPGEVSARRLDDQSYLAIIRDLTERKHAEYEIKRLNERITTATRASQVGIWDWDIKNDVLAWDDQMYTLYGLKKEQFTGAYEAWVNGPHPDDREFCQNEVMLALLGQKEYDVEFRVLLPDGSVRYEKAKGEVFRSEIGEPVRMVGINIDITKRKLIEKELQESEEYLKLGYETANLGIWKNDLNSMTVEFDERARLHYGFDEYVVTLPDVIARIHPDDMAKLISKIERATGPSGTGKYATEYRVIHPDGSIHWLYIGVRVIFEGEGENRRSVIGYGTSMDITERKQKEETLKKLEYIMSEGQKIAHMGTFEFLVDTQTTYWSAEEYSIYGLEPDGPSPTYEVMLAKCIHPDDAALLNQTFAASVQSQSVYELEHRIMKPDGTIRWVFDRAHPYFDQNGKLIRYVGTTLDITDRKEAEEEIRQLNERIATATNSAQVGIWDWDVVCNQLVWDDQMYALYGLKKEEFAGAYTAWVSGLHPDDREFCEEETRLALHGKKVYDTEFRVVWPDGTIRFLKSKGEVFHDNTGKPIRMVGVNFDITDRKTAEQTLLESRWKLETALSSMTDAIFISDTEGCFIDFNDAFATFHKFKNKDECAKTFDEYPQFLEVYLSTGELAPIEQWAVPRALKGEIVKNAEYKLRRKDTGETWIGSYSFSPIRDEDGVITGSVVTARDITEIKQAEEKIRKKDMEFRKLSANVPDLLFQFTRRPDGTYFVPIASEGIQNIFGCLPEDVIEDFTPIGRVIFPEDAERVIRDIEYSAEHLNYFTCEFRVQIPGREIQWIYSKSTPERLPDGSVTWYGFNTDITHQKHAEEALRESEEKFRMLMESIPLPVTYLNKEGEFVFRNARFLQVFGYTQDEVPTIKEWWLKAYPDKFYREWVIKKWESVVTNATQNNTDIESEDYRVTCKDGTERVIIISGILINDNLLITFIDITDRKKAEDEVRKLNETLEQRVEERTTQLQLANKELESFSYSVSHDLRAPLRHINGYVDLLNGRYEDNLPEKARHYLATITDAAKQMGKLIDDLLQFSRTGRQEIRKAMLDMNVLVKEVLEQIKPDVEKREITWSVQKMPEVFGDYSLLKQVWVNLLDNAVKYTKFKVPAEISIAFREEKANFVFSIRDNGVGFNMKYAHKLFGVFQRLHSQTEFEGTGIGLASVQRIIHKHNGTVWAEAEPNMGATFFFTIPKNKEDDQ